MLMHHAGNQHSTIFVGTIQTPFSNSHISFRTSIPLNLKAVFSFEIVGNLLHSDAAYPSSPQQQRPEELMTPPDTHNHVCFLADENSSTLKMVCYPRMTNGQYP